MTESLAINFRYLVPEDVFDELIEIAEEDYQTQNQISNGWILANRYENFAIIDRYMTTNESENCHNRPKSWMRLKKRKLYAMRKLKKDLDIDIVWQFHTHPNNNKELHPIDIEILKYLTTGVMIIVTREVIVGWYFKKLYDQKPYFDKMVFEVVKEENL
jgi:hypothetical protein